MNDESHTADLAEAYRLLRKVQLTLEDGPAEEAIAAVVRDLETAMSDRFDMFV